jgi:hypothetical protein
LHSATPELYAALLCCVSVPAVLSAISLSASRAERPPSGPEWLHEIKHDGFRIMARRNDNGVRLYTRNGYDFAGRFPQIVDAVSKLKVRSCFIDGEAIVVNERGLSAFDLLRSWRHDHAAVLCCRAATGLESNTVRLRVYVCGGPSSSLSLAVNIEIRRSASARVRFG